MESLITTRREKDAGTILLTSAYLLAHQRDVAGSTSAEDRLGVVDKVRMHLLSVPRPVRTLCAPNYAFLGLREWSRVNGAEALVHTRRAAQLDGCATHPAPRAVGGSAGALRFGAPDSDFSPGSGS
ncbi:hypothetical protein MSAN_02436900 [Mycena sanguinolenta]|uniref:Uncharacterized protein n=1 Tax=Mycena sanguinolenta TaxID=230812 RepID=A0A8H7CD49_9AGAR|nr:hypothetical protein MSAN_02436900 [Mycena sanguinolenta]